MDAARAAGYTVVDAVNVIGTHFSEVIRRYACEMFSRQDAKLFCDRVGEDNPKVVEDLVPKLLSLAVIQRVLQNLLRERVSIRDGVSILEALGEAAATTKNPVLLTEYVRQSIRRTVVKPYLNPKGELPAYLMDPSVEQAIEIGSAAHRAEQHSGAFAANGARDRHPHRAQTRQARGSDRRSDEFGSALLLAPDARRFV